MKAFVQNKAQHCVSSACISGLLYFPMRNRFKIYYKQTTVKKKREYIQRKYLPS